eukprot:2105660-Pleurochrysis_carterae.AAC.1
MHSAKTTAARRSPRRLCLGRLSPARPSKLSSAPPLSPGDSRAISDGARMPRARRTNSSASEMERKPLIFDTSGSLLILTTSIHLPRAMTMVARSHEFDAWSKSTSHFMKACGGKVLLKSDTS